MATETKAPSFTPGPWVVTSSEEPDVRGVDTFSVCFDSSPDGMALDGDDHAHKCIALVHGGSDEVSRANAYLIAAAPTMYAVLQRVAEHFADTDAPLGAAARAALVKAEGR